MAELVDEVLIDQRHVRLLYPRLGVDIDDAAAGDVL